jgi:hypothetical protein
MSGHVRKCRPVLCSVIAILLPAIAVGQTGVVTGRLTQAESGAPLAGAAVVPAGTGRGALSDSAGSFTIAGLAPRSYRLQARQQGYQEQERLVSIRPGETTFVSFSLAVVTQVLGAVRTEARAPDHELFLSRPSLGTTSLNSRSVSPFRGWVRRTSSG